jgi:hypothetical protein
LDNLGVCWIYLFLDDDFFLNVVWNVLLHVDWHLDGNFDGDVNWYFDGLVDGDSLSDFDDVWDLTVFGDGDLLDNDFLGLGMTDISLADCGGGFCALALGLGLVHLDLRLLALTNLLLLVANWSLLA